MIHGVDTSFLVAVEVIDHPRHTEAKRLMDELLSNGEYFAISPQVVTEFVHVVTDSKRFLRPLSVEEALDRIQFWWDSPESIPVLPVPATFEYFHSWMRQHKLGRKRLLDTFLAATYHAVSIRSILTLDPADFRNLA